jgi:hypothetical protein
MKEKELLYRKVNTRTRGVWHQIQNDAKHDRNTKEGISSKMKNKKKRGLDYTPLYKFLLSKIGQDFDIVYSEAVKRIDKDDAIFHIVDKRSPEDIDKDYIMSGNSYYSKLYIDDDNLLQYVNPNLKNEDFYPPCSCCTHTFNGKLLTNKHK